MAEEPKKKIDLKARLKTADAPPAPPPASSSQPGAVAPPPASSAAVPGMSGPGIPVPPGVAVASDASNPLAVAAGMARELPAGPARIEIDETEVHAASSKARRTGVIIGLAIGLLAAAGAFFAGSAQEIANGRKKSQADAKELKTNVEAAKAKLETLAKTLEDAQKQLAAKPGERKFPAELANGLGGVHVDFDGSQLAGRRFSGFPSGVMTDLTEMITGVASMEDNKTAVKNLITRLAANKPFVEQFNAPTVGKQIEYMVLLGGPTGKDPKGNYAAMISRLGAPIGITPDKIEIPADLTGTNPLGQGANVSSPVYKGGPLDKPVAMYVNPASWDNACPPETKSLAGQLGIKVGDVIKQIRGEPAQEGLVQDTKPGLIERADRLSKALEKI